MKLTNDDSIIAEETKMCTQNYILLLSIDIQSILFVFITS
jgi:hypothetical protein